MSANRPLYTPQRQQRRRVLLSLTTLALLSGPLQAPLAAEPLGVFVSLLPQKQFVERIAGAAVKVEVMVRPGQSPATYDPTPQQMVALARAAAYFRIGAPFENVWIPKIQSTHSKMRIVDTRAGITLLPMDKPAAGHGHSHAGPAAAGGTLDPHIWTDPLRAFFASIRSLASAERSRVTYSLGDELPLFVDAFEDLVSERMWARSQALQDAIERVWRERLDEAPPLLFPRGRVFGKLQP